MMSLATFNRWTDPVALDATGSAAVDAFVAVGVPHAIAEVLVRRGFATPAAASAYLKSQLTELLISPKKLPDIEAATARLVHAITMKRPITVFGDFDADGVCATAVLTRALRDVGGLVTPMVPHRHDDGRDLTPAMVAKIVATGAQVIVAIDCGSSALEGVAAARAAGLDVIIVDHHKVGPQFPAAHAFVNPQRADSQYAPAEVCATLLGFKVAWSVYAALGRSVNDLRWALDLVAIATIGDSMPLVGENRAVVKHTVRALSQTTIPGLAALLQAAKCAGRALSARDISFELVPRLNAPGRMWHAQQALELLLATTARDAAALAAFANMTNDHRKTEEERVLVKAREQAEALPDAPVLVLNGPSWHSGVVSIVAARIAEQYGRPCVVIVGEGEVRRGSARAPRGGDVYALFSALRSYLKDFGGHRGAVGFSLDATQVPAFTDALIACADAALGPSEVAAGVFAIEADVTLDALDAAFLDWLDKMGPFGKGHDEPLFRLCGVKLLETDRVGPYRNHLKGVVMAGTQRIRVFGPRLAESAPPEWVQNQLVDLIVAVESGRDGVSLRALDLRLREAPAFRLNPLPVLPWAAAV
jgi:single-stranded-DNA-specific exonuclease